MARKAAVFSTRVVTVLATISVVSFLLAFLLAGRGDDLFEPHDARANSFSLSAVGHRAFHDWLTARGFSTRRRRNPLVSAIADDFALVSIAPGAKLWNRDDGPSMHSLEMDAYVADAPFIIAPQKWSALAMADQRWTHSSRRIASEIVLGEINTFLEYLELPVLEMLDVEQLSNCHDTKGRVFTIDIPEPRVWAPHEELEATVACDEGVLIGSFTARERSAQLHLIADPDLLNNHGIGRGDHIDLLDAFLDDQLQLHGVEIDETLHGLARQNSFLAELLRFPLVLLTLQGLLTLAVVLWHGMGRFGKPTPSLAIAHTAGKAVLIENAANLLDLRGHSRESLESYYRSTMRAVGRTLFLDDDLPLADLEQRVFQLAAMRGGTNSIGDIRRSIADYSESSRRSDRALRIARRLYRWRQEIAHES